MQPLFTSLPPSISRRDPRGREIGPEYQQACVASWSRAGFAPHSVNSRAELSRLEPWSGRVEFHAVDRDARSLTGRPHIYLHDLLAIPLGAEAEHVVIANSDILLEPAFVLAGEVARLGPGRAIVAKRIDLDDAGCREGLHYPHGFDFFALHAADVRRIEDVGLVYGMPWWDYYLMTALCLLGVEVALVADPFAYHLRHAGRWSPALWRRLGADYAASLERWLPAEARPGDLGRGAELARELRAALGARPGVLRGALGRLAPGLGSGDRFLHRLSGATVDFMDRAFSRRIGPR